MDVTLSTEKLPGGSVKTVVRRTKRITVEMPDGQPISIYHEQEDVTYIDGIRLTAQSVDAVAIGSQDIADDEQVTAMQAVKDALEERVQSNDDMKVAQADEVAQLGKGDR